ncbi:MAG: PulJ/GspJ family protein [Opitutales bacterium]
MTRKASVASTKQVASPHPERASAFSLIEVLIALAVFAMASTYLVSTFVNALTARERSVSNDILHADIQAVRMQLLLEPNLEDAEDGGDYPTLNHGEARWEARIEPTEIVDLFQVEFRIDFSEPEEDQSGVHEEKLFLLRPTWSQGDERSELLQDKKEELQDRRDFDRF